MLSRGCCEIPLQVIMTSTTEKRDWNMEQMTSGSLKKKERQRETCFKNEERQTSDKRDRSGQPHGGAEKLYKQCI